MTTTTLNRPAHPVARRAVGWWMLQSTAVALPVFAGLAALGWFVEATRPYLTVAAVLATLFWLVGLLVEPFWRFRVHRWETTTTAVYARTGWLVREWRAAPLSRIQTVDATQGPLEQLLGLSTLKVTTASSTGAVEISGLSKETADRVAQELAEIAELTPGDAT
ncbi:PH domain-containing protein [Corynebacterium sp.]|jgi:membrane protein YdbS with pleckstrin-like domain|uniref:PH domain-containing protein n=1 Tax=Corynebacterium sp. TaxID=1720 RepID=UPI0025BBF016|nr:PH domain-containing protein [Corynebacterium sp.]